VVAVRQLSCAMASTAGFALSLHQDDYSMLLLSDSEDDEYLVDPSKTPQTRESPRPEPIEENEDVMRKKTHDAAANIPLHPIPAMQSAFAESLIEATANPTAQKPKLRFGDAKERRAQLIDGEEDEELHGEQWRYRPGQTHHELWKLMAQISFGVYLLLNGIANSNIQVVNILQGHIDEVDEFLEVVLEDVNLATKDVQERIDFLKLPMSNIPTFEKMLEDRAFRLQIVTGNEKIEHIVSRTATSLEANLKDAEEGLKATKEFAVYLGHQQNGSWRQQRPDVIDIFDAMKGNAEGWYKAFVDLQGSVTSLDGLLVQLSQIVAEMDRRAGEVSRRTRVSPLKSAFELSIRASALMPLQFSVAPFTGPAADASRITVRTPDASARSSPRSSSSRGHSEHGSPSSSSGQSSPGSPSHKSPQSSPSAGDVLPDSQFGSPRKRASIPRRGSIPEVDTALEIREESKDTRRPSPIEEEEGLYILQPRIYTPQPPEPSPSPTTYKPASPKLEEVPKRTSLRQRLSLKGNNPPESIQVPPRNVNRPRYQSPRVNQSPRTNQVPDSAYGSDVESRLLVRSMADPFADNLSPPAFPSTIIPSPLSDQQHFRPVQASPHSPLQRPWTSGPPAATAIPRPHTSATQYHNSSHQRNAPSAMGMSLLSNVTTMNPGGKGLKKKRSAFGWLKKAFSLDEEERAAFEAKKQRQAHDLYNDSRSPKFLDGRRREEYRQY
jgi:hypothetical protein